MLINAMHAYQMAKRSFDEAKKAQYTDKLGENDGAIKWFRASGLGDPDRKSVYKFFAHQLPTVPKSAQNLRQLENGDFVHQRYQTAWEQMGIMISSEERLTSKDDEYLAQFDFEIAGHYDGELDINIIRAHALGKVTLNSFFNEETETWELEVELDEAYANSIGIYDENGDIAEDYEPPVLIADIKTMNPWGFKAIKDKGDLSKISGYLDQIMFYMYMKNTPYGSLHIEAKDNNADIEVQVLWRDLHDTEEDPYTYEWDETIHGVMDDDKVRVVVTSDRFFGSDTQEGVIQKAQRLWEIRNQLIEADKAGDMEAIRNIMPVRCSDDQTNFPCSWGHKTGKPSYCEFYDHCWNKHHHGLAVRPFEAVPAEFIWEFEEDNGDIIKVDSRKVPEGVNEETFANLIGMGALKLELFLIEDLTEEPPLYDEDESEGFHEGNLFDGSGELNIMAPVMSGDVPTEAPEYIADNGSKAIDCLKCGKQIQYQKLANGGTKKCPHCKHTQKVARP